jgi:hypothetical protein
MKNMLGINGPGRRNRTSDFWYDTKKSVEMALKDLELFIEVAGKKVDEIVTEKSLEPIIYVLLWNTVTLNKTEGGLDLKRNRAEVARLFIKLGLKSLWEMAPEIMKTGSNNQTKELAVDLANALAESLKPEKERRYVRAHYGVGSGYY